MTFKKAWNKIKILNLRNTRMAGYKIRILDCYKYTKDDCEVDKKKLSDCIHIKSWKIITEYKFINRSDRFGYEV